MEQLLRTMRNYLSGKRYFILIDDIWSVSAWELLQSALPLNDNGSRIITTTRSKMVAQSCCAGVGAQMYEAKPLTDEDSQKLFFKRLFRSSEDCPQDLRKVSGDILKKCGGLPLAIISIAGLLATRSQTKEIWINTMKSISGAVDKDSPIDRMKRILLLSYFDLPPHLKSCLLYLSVFPEDYLIDCRRLILLWVAEGLIPGQYRESMEHLGRSYLNDLINRSLVQPTKVGADGTKVKECRVHDVILEFIVSKAVEDNFVTIWNRNGFSANYPSNKIRRLSIQEDISGQAEEIAKTIKNAAHIRSINIFGSNTKLDKHVSEFLSSQVLRVLNIGDDVVGKERYLDLGHVRSFGQLKYLGMYSLISVASPSSQKIDIEKLQHLETIDVRYTTIAKLPASILQLQRLVRLYVPWDVQLPDGIGNLKALEELSTVGLCFQSVKCIQGLGNLTHLRVLKINGRDTTKVRDVEDHRKACISSLSKLLMSLEELHVGFISDPAAARLLFMALCVPTPPLGKLVHTDIINPISIVPHQISSLVNLTRLRIGLAGKVINEGINILASLPMLLSLTVQLNGLNSGSLHSRLAITQGFQCLIKLNFYFALQAVLEFEPEAMPKLQILKLQLQARLQFMYGHGGMVLGLQNLAGLKHVGLNVYCGGATADEVQALEDDIRGAVGAHPNRPILQVERMFQEDMAQGCSRRPSDYLILQAP